METEIVDGSICDGFPGLLYKLCNGCGYADPQRKATSKNFTGRMRKERNP